MANFNHITLVGTLTRDPELKNTQSGTAMTKFSLAVNREYKGKKEVLFVNVMLWGKTAEVAVKYLQKGSQALIAGRLACSKYKDKNGNDREDWHVIGETLQFIGSKKGSSKIDEPSAPNDDISDDDSIPF